MPLPFFYLKQTIPGELITLDEETSRHMSQVLRMKKDEQLKLTDGKGSVYTAEIANDHKKATVVRVLDSNFTVAVDKKITIAISLVKNNNRFEWFLEKAAELGITEVIPLICERTEKQHFRQERMENILISAMLQSQQAWMTRLSAPVEFPKALDIITSPLKFIAHCSQDDKWDLVSKLSASSESCILIGPEGDFTKKEIDGALEKSYVPVTLGETRLRTETAGIVAATLLKLVR